MTRHYVEGMIFCLGAIITYNHGVKRQSLLWMLISANFYFFAMLAKEFYAPLPLFLFFMHSQLFGKRILFLFAHAIVALAYILWRFYMLGVPQDIYGTSFNSMSLTSLYSLADVPLLLYGVVGTLIISALVLYLVWRSYLNQSFQGVFLVVALGICILLPLVPLAISVGFEFHLRYLLVPHAAIAILVSFALLHLARSHGTGWAAGLALLLFFFTALSAIQGSERNIASARAFDVQSRFLWEQDASSAILPSFEYALGYYHYAFLTDIKKEKFFVSTPPVLIHPAFAPSYSNLQFKKYSPACECMTDVSASLFRGQKKLGGNLQSTLVREANIFRWSIGAAELTNTGLTTTASRLPFAGAGQGSSGYKLCAILLNNGVTTGMLFTKCGGEFNTSHLIRGAELLKSEILFKATTNNGEDLYSEIYRNPEVKND